VTRRQTTTTLRAILVSWAFAGAAFGQTTLEAYTARTLTRVAHVDLRLAPRPTPDDFKVTAALLSIAHELDPTDETILRAWAEASYEAGDSETVLRTARLLLQIDPKDSVSLLRLASGQIAKKQTVSERIDAYERLIDSEGAQSIPASVRSRLALDMALLLRERGDSQGFAERLSQAIALDSTNKEAAALAAAWYSESINDPIGRLDLLSNLLYADPLDPHVHLAIRDELVRGGAFAEATRFHDNAGVILRSLENDPGLEMLLARRVLDWHTKGPQAVADVLNRNLLQMRDQAERLIEDYRRAGQEVPPEARTPDQTRLSRPLDLLRLLAADAAGDTTTMGAAIDDLERSILESTERLRAMDRQQSGASVDQLAASLASLQSDRMMARFWTNQNTEEAAQQLAALEQFLAEMDAAREGTGGGRGPDGEEGDATSGGASAGGDGASPSAEGEPFEGEFKLEGLAADQIRPMLDIFRGWVELREGDPGKALAIFEPKARDEGQPFAVIGSALAHERLGQSERAIDLLMQIAREQPITPTGAWARSRAHQIKGEEIPFSSVKEELRAFSASIPGWLDRIATDPRRALSVSIGLTSKQVTAVEKVAIKWRIRNVSPIPLGFGPNRPIDSRLMIQPRTDAGIRQLQGMLQPEIVDLGRRLRLDPGEALEVEIWPDPAASGMLVETLASQQTRTRWRLIQGFQVDEKTKYKPGLAGLTGETDLVTRPRLEATTVSFVELSRRIRYKDADALPALLVSARAKQPLPGQETRPPDGSGTYEDVATALGQRFTEGDAVTRMAILAAMPSSTLAASLAPLDEAIGQTEIEDPRVLLVLLLTRAVDPENPLFEKARAMNDPRVAEAAERLAERLREDRPTYATLGVAPSRRPTGPAAAAPGEGGP